MSLFRVMDIAGSALGAQTIRMNTTASNMANANSASSSIDQTYKARHPVFSQLVADFSVDEDPSVGVKVDGIVESNAPAQVDGASGQEAGYSLSLIIWFVTLHLEVLDERITTEF